MIVDGPRLSSCSLTPRLVLVALAVVLAIAVAGCGGVHAKSVDWSPSTTSIGGLTETAHVDGESLILSTKAGDRDFVAGVNIGSTVPGKQPGELAATAGDYRRWFPEIASMGLHVIRIYTILPPCFYQELSAFNKAHPNDTLYLIQGVWIPEDEFLAKQDLYDPTVHDAFKREISDAVAVVHGTLEREQRKGSAWGKWNTDVSQWVYAYSIGVEWDPQATSASDKKNAGHAGYKGKYFSSKGAASPTEIWLSEMLDWTAAQEAARGSTMPLTFTNWPTTDPLKHADEPLEDEDLVGVDATHISVSSAWPAGYFASFHVYPYYPDFQRYEPALQKTNYNGKSDPYAGYLRALKNHFAGMPLVITEFGVPSSMSLAHYGPLGRDQGNHSDQEEMATDAEMLRIIHDTGCSGGCVFEWTDEWFKFTWNTVDYELPGDRRQLWVNPWTNEEHFGLMATDPGETSAVTVDGKDKEWLKNSSQVIYEGRAGLREVRAVKDEGYLYLRLIVDDADVWKKQKITIGVDIIDGGNGGLPGLKDKDAEADYAIVLGPGKQGQAYVRASNDQYEIMWGKVGGYIPYNESDLAEGSGVWNKETLITNRPLTIPSTGVKKGAESVNSGNMRYGTTDPKSKNFDSRATWCAGKCIEIRLPYEAIGFSDPSSLKALRVGQDGAMTTEDVKRLGITVALGDQVYKTNGYGWEPWQTVKYHERLKAGSDIFIKAVTDVTGSPLNP